MRDVGHDRDALSIAGAPAWAQALGRRFRQGGGLACGVDRRALDGITLEDASRLRRLPYDEPEFSRRIVRLQIAPDTDQGSRPEPQIREQVDWLLRTAPRSTFDAVFHPMCGPGLFAKALLGRCARYDGIDVGPATVACARQAAAWPPRFSFKIGDARRWRPERAAYGLALLTYETFNAFPERELAAVLANVAEGLRCGGLLLCEVRPPGPSHGERPTREVRWHGAGSLFSDAAHLLLAEGQWVAGGRLYIDRFFVLHSRDVRACSTYHSVVWSHDRAAIRSLLSVAALDIAWAGKPFSFDSTHAQRYQNRWILARRY